MQADASAWQQLVARAQDDAAAAAQALRDGHSAAVGAMEQQLHAVSAELAAARDRGGAAESSASAARLTCQRLQLEVERVQAAAAAAVEQAAAWEARARAGDDRAVQLGEEMAAAAGEREQLQVCAAVVLMLAMPHSLTVMSG